LLHKHGQHDFHRHDEESYKNHQQPIENEVIDKLDQATDLLKLGLHLRQYGENAPGGNETWKEFDTDAENFLSSLLNEG